MTTKYVNAELNARIKKVRSDSRLSQENFGKRIGISGAAVAMIEVNTNNASDPTIQKICEQFNVRREWLETGDGKPYNDAPRLTDQQIIANAMAGQSENKKRLMRILAEMPDELLEKMVEYLESKLK